MDEDERHQMEVAALDRFKLSGKAWNEGGAAHGL